MRFPWQARAEKEEQRADRASEELKRTEENWFEAIRLAEMSKNQRETNGWTGKVVDIFSGKA